MIVAAVTGIGVLSALWSATRWKRLARLDLHHIWLVWTGFLTQVIVFQWIAPHMAESHVKLIHLGTYAILVTFIVLNRHIPGAWMIALGTAFNLIAIVANGGSMPASRWALEYAGKHIPSEAFQNSAALAHPKLLFLGDVFALPYGVPLANVFSVGDVLIVLGGTYLAHVWCSQPHELVRPLSSLLPWPPGATQRAADLLHAPTRQLQMGSLVIELPTVRPDSVGDESTAPASIDERAGELVGAHS